MKTSPYDSLPMGYNDVPMEISNHDESPEVASPAEEVLPPEKSFQEETIRYVEVAPAKIPHKKTSPIPETPHYSHMNILGFDGITQFILPFEDTLLVPDTMPDMQKLHFAEGRADLAMPGKSSYSPDEYLSGDITVYTVYSPAAGPVDVVKSVIPFKTDKCWSSRPCDSFRVSVEVKSLSPDMINERKFTVSGELLIKITGVSSKSLPVFKGCSDAGLIAAEDSLQVSDLVFEATEELEISQEITIGDDNPSPVRILKESFDITENHRQITSGKLVINGVISTQILYLGDDGGELILSCITNKTDFTQFVPVDDSVTADLIMVTFNNNGLQATIENRDKFLLQGNVNTLIQAYRNRGVPMVYDAYHTTENLVFDITSVSLNNIITTVSGELSSREVINIAEEDRRPQKLLCGDCHILELKGHRQRDRVIIEGLMPITILAIDEDNRPFVIRHTMQLRGTLEMPSLKGTDIDLYVFGNVKSFWFDNINSRQIEINASLNTRAWASSICTFTTIENLCFEESDNTQKRASMALYTVDSDDTLWNIAKKYKTDIASLAAINRLDPQKPLTEGLKLFIAK